MYAPSAWWIWRRWRTGCSARLFFSEAVLLKLEGHQRAVANVTYSDDGQMIATSDGINIGASGMQSLENSSSLCLVRRGLAYQRLVREDVSLLLALVMAQVSFELQHRTGYADASRCRRIRWTGCDSALALSRTLKPSPPSIMRIPLVFNFGMLSLAKRFGSVEGEVTQLAVASWGSRGGPMDGQRTYIRHKVD